MKIIFDFDDTLFSTEDFKKVVFSGLEKFGVSGDVLARYYSENRGHFTNPRKFYYSFVLDKKLNVSSEELEEVLNEIFSDLKRFLNQEFIDIIKRFGPENCFLVSAGEKDFQMKKIKHCELDELFGEIHIVEKDKNEAIKSLMDRFKGEDFVFIDDNQENIEKAKEIMNDEQKLHTVHYPHELEEFRCLVK